MSRFETTIKPNRYTGTDPTFVILIFGITSEYPGAAFQSGGPIPGAIHNPVMRANGIEDPIYTAGLILSGWGTEMWSAGEQEVIARKNPRNHLNSKDFFPNDQYILFYRIFLKYLVLTD